MPKGIDIYEKYQRVNSWSALYNAGWAWMYMKLSDGLTTRNDMGYGPAGKANGLFMGGYHFSQGKGNGTPTDQANLLVRRCTEASMLGLGPALDLEDNPRLPSGARDPRDIPDSQKPAWALEFMLRVHSLGHKPTLYCSDSVMKFVRPYLIAHGFTDFWTWVARYGGNPVSPWDLWQHTSTGRVSGITATNVDQNTGAVPFNVRGFITPTDMETIMTGINPQALPHSPGGDYMVYPLEVGDNSSVIASQWVVLNSGFGDTEYEIITIGPDQTIVGVAGDNGYPTSGVLHDRERAVWAMPNNCEGVAIRYKNLAGSRTGIAFPNRSK